MMVQTTSSLYAQGLAWTLVRSVFRFNWCRQYSKNEGDNSKALSKDSPSHQHLGVSGVALLKGAEAEGEDHCCPQTPWGGQGDTERGLGYRRYSCDITEVRQPRCVRLTYGHERVLFKFDHKSLLERLVVTPRRRGKAFNNRRLSCIEGQ